jgi:butyryl-CoA dehydrogenase
MVLARLPDAPAGVKGISLFLVPKFMDDGSRNDVYVGQLQHKMGAHAASNCEMLFGDRTSEGAVGYLIGKENEGLKNMFNMMNEARIFVGATACGSGIAGYQYSLQYARDRRQGRHASNKDPKTPMVPIIEHADVKRMLLAQKSYAEGSLALCTLGAYFQDMLEHAESGTDAEGTHEELESLLELMIPVIKSWPSEWCLEANKWAIQVLGGYGYTKDYLAEQIYRSVESR